jgi:hypothetical protein
VTSGNDADLLYILLDFVTDVPMWADWSIAQLDAAALKGPLVINETVYAEVSVRFATIEAVGGLWLRSISIPAPRPAAPTLLLQPLGRSLAPIRVSQTRDFGRVARSTFRGEAKGAYRPTADGKHFTTSTPAALLLCLGYGKGSVRSRISRRATPAA